MTRILTALLALISISAIQAQDLKLPRIFSDGMVLQREQSLRLWGWGKAGETVTVEIDGFEVKTKIDANGNWECLYPAHEAGGPFEVNVSSGETITLSDVYIGDVWVAGGQSNMEWSVGAQIDNMEAELADSDYPQIRFFKVAKRVAMKPMYDLAEGEWKLANSENTKAFSAVAWFFAKKNHLEKGVPVGIIDNNWGGTPAESWTSAQTLLGVNGYKTAAAEMLDSSIDWESRLAENTKKNTLKWQMIQDEVEYLKNGAQNIKYNDSAWKEVILPNQEALSDFVWVRKSFKLSKSGTAKLSLGNTPQNATVFINGQRVYSKNYAKQLDIIEVQSGILKKGKNVIAIRAINDWDNRVFIGESDNLWIKIADSQISLEGAWKYSNSVEPKMPEVINYSWNASSLFNGMILPIVGYPIKGAIWYQGESNVGKHQYYRELFGEMIQDWRTYWKQGNFPFLFVQLANWQARYDEPTDSDWAALQEAQTQTLELPNTGMAVTIDIGDAKDIHPRNKQDVGVRLWLAARKAAFGEELVYSGPMYKSHIIEGKNVTLTYDNIGSGLQAKGDKIVGFALAGADGEYHWAQANIEGDKVILASDQVPEPVSVRYAWADNPACNLYNKEGLPAVPFRTDGD